MSNATAYLDRITENVALDAAALARDPSNDAAAHALARNFARLNKQLIGGSGQGAADRRHAIANGLLAHVGAIGGLDA